MLEYVRIKNFGLLEDVHMEFSKGLNVITGESGAGKSFIIKALLFLMGHKMPPNIVRNGCDTACVEAVFSTATEDIILRRELSATSGRSRFFINDILSSQDTVKNMRDSLIIYTSQHAQQKLLQSAFHTTFLDIFLKNEDTLAKRDALLQEMRICKKKQEELAQKYSFLAERRDLLEFQQKEIQAVAPEVDEEEDLEEKKSLWKNAQHIVTLIQNARHLLTNHGEDSLLQSVQQLRTLLQQLTKIDSSFEEAIEALEPVQTHLETIIQIIQQPIVSVPNIDIEAIEARLYELSKLKRSLHRNLTEICSLEKEIEENLSFLDSCELDMKHLKKEEGNLVAMLLEVLTQLNTERHAGANILAKELEERLIPLGFAKECTVSFSFTPQEIWEECFEDKARLLWCPNPGNTAMPLETIASGGELSRFLLAMTSIFAEHTVHTIIFDEVDTGIGGNILKSVAERIVHLSQQQQIILITHWAQMAKHGATHFLVQKTTTSTSTTTNVLSLHQKEREQELQRMNGE